MRNLLQKERKERREETAMRRKKKIVKWFRAKKMKPKVRKEKMNGSAILLKRHKKKRKELELQSLELSESAKAVEEILVSAKADNKIESPVTILKVFIASRDHTVEEIVGELKRLQLSRGLDDSQRVKILLEALIDTSNPATVVPQFAKHAALLKKLASDKNTGNVLLVCIEELVGVIEKKNYYHEYLLFYKRYMRKKS